MSVKFGVNTQLSFAQVFSNIFTFQAVRSVYHWKYPHLIVSDGHMYIVQGYAINQWTILLLPCRALTIRPLITVIPSINPQPTCTLSQKYVIWILALKNPSLSRLEADATVYVWFLGQLYVHKTRTCFSRDSTGFFMSSRVRSPF